MVAGRESHGSAGRSQRTAGARPASLLAQRLLKTAAETRFARQKDIRVETGLLPFPGSWRCLGAAASWCHCWAAHIRGCPAVAS